MTLTEVDALIAASPAPDMLTCECTECQYPLTVSNPKAGAGWNTVSCWCGKSGAVWRNDAGALRFDGYIMPTCDDPGPPSEQPEQVATAASEAPEVVIAIQLIDGRWHLCADGVSYFDSLDVLEVAAFAEGRHAEYLAAA